MSSLILEIQAEALDQGSDVSALLRKALAASKKLDITDMEEWLDNELGGYGDVGQLPGYRKLKGIIRCWNPYRGWIPLHMPPEYARSAERLWLVESMAMLVNATKSKEGMIQYALPVGKSHALMKAMQVPLEPAMFISVSSIIGVIDTVRTHVLKWALALEKSGVIGESMSFSLKEVQAAAQINYITNIGVMSSSQLQQGSTGSQSMALGKSD